MESMATGRALRRVSYRPVGGAAPPGSQTIHESTNPARRGAGRSSGGRRPPRTRAARSIAADRSFAWLQFFLRVVQASRLLVGRRGATLHAMDTRNHLMKTTNFVALVVGLLLTAAAFLAVCHDARHGVALYQAKLTTALPAHR